MRLPVGYLPASKFSFLHPLSAPLLEPLSCVFNPIYSTNRLSSKNQYFVTIFATYIHVLIKSYTYDTKGKCLTNVMSLENDFTNSC